MQAKDLPDAALLDRLTTTAWIATWDLQAQLPGVPPKVVLAKLRSLRKRHLVQGCGCGCRGDWHLPGCRCCTPIVVSCE